VRHGARRLWRLWRRRRRRRRPGGGGHSPIRSRRAGRLGLNDPATAGPPLQHTGFTAIPCGASLRPALPGRHRARCRRILSPPFRFRLGACSLLQPERRRRRRRRRCQCPAACRAKLIIELDSTLSLATESAVANSGRLRLGYVAAGPPIHWHFVSLPAPRPR
jgi:hypothetical protein